MMVDSCQSRRLNRGLGLATHAFSSLFMFCPQRSRYQPVARAGKHENPWLKPGASRRRRESEEMAA